MSEQYRHLEIEAPEAGGYIVMAGERNRDFGRCRSPIAAFSTLPEAMQWIGRNMVERNSGDDQGRYVFGLSSVGD